MPETILNSHSLEKLSSLADELLMAKEHDELKKFLDTHLGNHYTFEKSTDEAQFYYILGNCSQELFNYRNLKWFSDDLSHAVIFFRKALHLIQNLDFPTDEELFLKSCIETNLGNNLSSQGRLLCCIPLWDSALSCKHNPVPIISKANNELSLADSVYDPGHQYYHYFTAYNLITQGLDHLDLLYPEQRIAYSENSTLMNFKAWFEDNFSLDDFEHYDSYEENFETRKQADYLKWCGDNRLFINDLNDVCVSEIVYQDIMTLPSFSQKINISLSMSDELMYHGNFDELKNDYCYARFLIFSAKDIPSDDRHFFNNTFPHIDDMAYTITNLKASHYKSAFRTLFSIFDKIAYFINRFFDLNPIKNDRKIDFDSIFRELNSKKQWKPNNKLENSNNFFLHALFYILKDIRDVNDSTAVHHLVDPDAMAFTDIRNAIEHRSLKIVDDFGYTLIHSDRNFRKINIDKINSDIESYNAQLQKLYEEIAIAKISKVDGLKEQLELQKEALCKDLERAISKLNEKEKLSSHSVIIKESEFKSSLMTLMSLVRNSIMYLSLAIHLEQKNNLPDDGVLMMPKIVPLKY